MGAGFGAPPASLPASFTTPSSGGLDDLFDLGGGVGMPAGAYSPPKTVSFYIFFFFFFVTCKDAMTNITSGCSQGTDMSDGPI